MVDVILRLVLLFNSLHIFQPNSSKKTITIDIIIDIIIIIIISLQSTVATPLIALLSCQLEAGVRIAAIRIVPVAVIVRADWHVTVVMWTSIAAPPDQFPTRHAYNLDGHRRNSDGQSTHTRVDSIGIFAHLIGRKNHDHDSEEDPQSTSSPGDLFFLFQFRFQFLDLLLFGMFFVFCLDGIIGVVRGGVWLFRGFVGG